ncbi:hypothetical protein H696_05656 [Fonticula alba]|uniref:Dimethylargininase n=1 Tax=Fonticula alba TaxID=691883 RepID=A0A058Z102_FONAL|nr:hypothetical protein H696_05656 [Fonticula alba]KCV67930.1 hypothetical protein H696_05656 [Fonticula alba]|eukprot:XP_009497750.1 hypothetical protein H696_05656 [Fonticula alba]
MVTPASLSTSLEALGVFPGDFALLGTDTLLLGAGAKTPEHLITSALEHATQEAGILRVAHVRDVFDRDVKARATLSSVIRFHPAPAGTFGEGLLVELLKDSFTPAHRIRRVDVYERSAAEAPFGLVCSDLSLPSFLRTFQTPCPGGSSSFGRRAARSSASAVLAVCPVDVLAADPAAWVAGFRGKQSSNRVLMVAPSAFTSNAEAAQDNYFMAAAAAGENPAATPAAAASDGSEFVLREHAGLVAEMEAHGVSVVLASHSYVHDTPDACFPNNWFSTHIVRPGAEAGATSDSVGNSKLKVLYPMKCENRRRERRPDLVALLSNLGYQETIDMSAPETAGQALEGTGVLVLDRVNRVAYVAASERAQPELAAQWAERLGYRAVVFTATDINNRTIYHTNVMMAVGTSVAVVCLESVDNAEALRQSFAATGHEVVDITRQQVQEMCGNVLEVESATGLPVMVMSARARAAFTPEQIQTIEKHCPGGIVAADLGNLERIGGGSARCTIAELF